MSCVWNIKCNEHLSSSTTRCSVWNMTSSDCVRCAPPLMCGIWHQVCILAVPCSVKSALCDQAGPPRRRWRSLTGKIGSFIHAPASQWLRIGVHEDISFWTKCSSESSLLQSDPDPVAAGFLYDCHNHNELVYLQIDHNKNYFNFVAVCHF